MGDFIELGGIYSRKGKQYIVSKYQPGKFLSKDADAGNYTDCVEFQPYGPDVPEADKDMEFVLLAKDFTAKFERVEA